MMKFALVAAAALGGALAQEDLGTVIGIDLGTTYSCVGVFQNGRVEIIANDQGNRITPSYVAWDDAGERLIGDAAKNQATINPENTVFDVKRLIGRKFNEKSVQADKKLFPFALVPNPAAATCPASSPRRRSRIGAGTPSTTRGRLTSRRCANPGACRPASRDHARVLLSPGSLYVVLTCLTIHR